MRAFLRRLLAGALTGLVAVASAQTPSSPGSSVSLEQVPREPGGTSLEIPQPAPPSRRAAVTSSEVPADGQARTLATFPLVGSDRCDPATATQSSTLCRRRLETRSGEYTRPRPAPVTSEGRLLLLTTPRGGGDAGQLTPLTGLEGANGPAEQLAGALQSQTASPDASPTTGSTASLPAGVPTTIILPPR